MVKQDTSKNIALKYSNKNYIIQVKHFSDHQSTGGLKFEINYSNNF